MKFRWPFRIKIIPSCKFHRLIHLIPLDLPALIEDGIESECKFMEIDKLKYRHVRLIFPLLQTRRDYHRRLMDFNKTFSTETLFAQNADFYRFIHVT